MRTIRWRASVPASLITTIGLSLFFGAWMSIGIVQKITLDSHITYAWSPWDERMDVKMFKMPPNARVDYAQVKDDADFPDWNPTRLQELLESPTTLCRRLTNLGGVLSCANCHTCQIDGNKYTCFDDDVRPVPNQCLIYSFGVGGETSWDRAMKKLKCDIYAFDMTTKWENMVLDDGFHFLNLGLFHDNYDADLNMTSSEDNNRKFVTKKGYFRTLATIREILGHTNRPIDVLKMDIEFTEWDVFEMIFNNSENAKVLDDVKQIALEIHLDDFKNISAAARVAGGRRVEKILQDMHDYGFHVAHTELNTAFQVHAEVRGQVVPLFRETLFLNRP